MRTLGRWKFNSRPLNCLRLIEPRQRCRCTAREAPEQSNICEQMPPKGWRVRRLDWRALLVIHWQVGTTLEQRKR